MKKRATRGLSFETLMSVERVGSPAVSPDGRYAVYVLSQPKLADNRMHRTLYRLDLATDEVDELTPGPGEHSDPAWSPDGAEIAFVSTRGNDGPQLWTLRLDGGEARQITTGYGGVSSPVWAPDGSRIAFVRSVVVSSDYAGKKGKDDPSKAPTNAEIHGLAHPKSSGKIADGLLFRHWDEWRNRHRKHVFVVDLKSGRMVDLTPFDCDAPPLSLDSGRDIAWSPRSDEIAYVMNPDEVVARSTNNCVFVQKLGGIKTKGEPQCISTSDACDTHPRYSADGKHIFYLAMDVPVYEADRNRLKVYDRGSRETTVHLESFDRSPHGFEFLSDGEIVFVAQDLGRQSVYRYDAHTRTVRQLTAGVMVGSVAPIPGREELLVTVQSTNLPSEIARIALTDGFAPSLDTPAPVKAELAKKGWCSGAPERVAPGLEVLTESKRALAKTSLNDAIDFWAPGAGGTPIHGYLIHPAGFDPKKKYPLIFLIHGGPQSAFGDDFHYRWNAQHFASQGACVAFVNPRGSTGYGQKFTDQISGDWGGRCYDDIMNWLDALLAANRYLDPKRVAAAGASFGGFMVNWICGHTDRFRALVSHDGIFNAETMAYTTEELWFDEHEHGGLPHENRKAFQKFSPHLHVSNFKTPTLVVQGGRDYRCPESEGIGMYTALQVMGVESRFLFFPDEGHWVMQPANSQVWYDQVLGWMMDRIG
ncbi:MAG: S9 family peptidase [Candidatus Eisenbacteria bacterium]